MDPARLTPTGRRKSRPYVPEGTEARGRSGLAATGTGAGEGWATALPGPGGGVALAGAAIEIVVAGVTVDGVVTPSTWNVVNALRANQ